MVGVIADGARLHISLHACDRHAEYRRGCGCVAGAAVGIGPRQIQPKNLWEGELVIHFKIQDAI